MKKINAIIRSVFFVFTLTLLAVSTVHSESGGVTSSELAVPNLNSQINTLENLTRRFPERDEFRRQLFDLLLLRTQFLGSYREDFPRLQQLVERTTTAEDLKLRARYLTAVHLFGAAEDALSRAEAISGNVAGLAPERLRIDIARGLNLQTSAEAQRERVKVNPGYENFVLAALLEGELGNFEQAHTYLEEAIKSYRGSSPFPIAYVYFQRGVMWGERAGDDAKAKADYERATAYLPQYVVAQVHLSEILSNEGNADEAILRLRTVSGTSDPEPKGLLGEILLAKADTEGGQALIEEARADYNSLLTSFPEAFADHGSEFFAGPGQEPERALALAKANLAVRKTQRSYLVAIEAALAARNLEVACQIGREALTIQPTASPLLDILRSLEGDCGVST